MKPKTLRSTFTVLFAALICLGCFISIPIGPVPITIQNMFAILAACILGGLNGAGAVGIFIVLGTIGLPVFSGCHGGVSYLAGPTGGFIIGYFIGALVAGLIVGTPHTFEKKFSWRNYGIIALAALVGYALIYVSGIPYFMHVMADTGKEVSFSKALSLCLIPFIPIDIAKLAVTIPLAAVIRPIAARYFYPPEDDEAIFNDIKEKTLKRQAKDASGHGAAQDRK